MLRAAANSGGVEERCSGGGERRDEEGGGGVDDGPSLEEVLNMSKYSNLLSFKNKLKFEIPKHDVKYNDLILSKFY